MQTQFSLVSDIILGKSSISSKIGQFGHFIKRRLFEIFLNGLKLGSLESDIFRVE